MQSQCKRQSYTQWKWPENVLQCKQRHCGTHCKPETKQTADSSKSNACVCLLRSLKL